MALGYNQKNYQENIRDFEEEFNHNLSEAIIPFSKISENEVTKYIYMGNEKIPFNVRHPKYKRILIAEFAVD